VECQDVVHFPSWTPLPPLEHVRVDGGHLMYLLSIFLSQGEGLDLLTSRVDNEARGISWMVNEEGLVVDASPWGQAGNLNPIV